MVKQIVLYQNSSGNCPFEKWLKKIDNIARQVIQKRILRLAHGNFGDFKKLTKISQS